MKSQIKVRQLLMNKISLAFLWIVLAVGFSPVVMAKDVLKVGVLVAQTGPAGLFGPASKNLAELAKEQINADGGILGKEIELYYVDVGVGPAEAKQAVLKLWKRENVDVFIGMHDSAVRNTITELFDGKVPYIYTATHSGGECSAATFILGETPTQQLERVIPWIAKNENIKNWYLIGNDYVWPHSTNKVAKVYIEETGGKIVGEEYLPFDVQNYDASYEKIKNSGADAVLITLVGGRSVQFNRGFALFGLDKKVLRLGTLIEANTLAGIGVNNADNLYSTSGYFASIDSPSAKILKEQYVDAYGVEAPALSSLAESVYEGMLFLKAIAEKAGEVSPEAFSQHAEGTTFNGPRGESTMHKRHIDQNIYLAKASDKQGEFEVIETFNNIDSGSTCSTN